MTAATARGLFRATGKKSRPVHVRDLLTGEIVLADALEREPNEFYPTPPEPTRAILAAEGDRLREFGTIWEPAAGDGAMLREMRAVGPAGRMDFESETFVTTVAPTLDAHYGRLHGASGQDARHGHGLLVASGPVAPPLTGNPYGDHESREDLLVAHTLRAEGFDASEDGTGRGTRLVPVSVAIRGREGGGTVEIGDDVAHTIRASQGGGDKPHVLAPIAFNSREDPEVTWDRTGALSASSPQSQAIAYGIDSDCLDRSGEGVGGTVGERAGLGITEGHINALGAKRPGAVAHGWAVRRLTPRECCRLQGVPADYFDEVVWRGKSPPPDGPIYKTLGNGFSANAVRWIGTRIEMVEAIFADLSALEAAE